MSIPETGAQGPEQGPRFRLAHISDPHLTSLEGVRWYELVNKRLLGWMSWKFKRRYIHRPELLRRLQEDLQQCGADHIAVTGDLTQLGTVPECRQGLAWLQQLGDPERVSTIPGNHDRYAHSSWARSVGQWAAYMQGDSFEGKVPTPAMFPALRMRGPVALIGLSTALPTAPFLASGRLGRKQLEGLEYLLEKTGKQGCFRMVMLHHGPVPGTYSRRRSLRDDRRFCDILKRKGAEAVLHGHGHRRIQQVLPGNNGDIPVFGAASASYSHRDPERSAAYNIYEIAASEGGWRLTATTRLYDFDNESFREDGSREFLLPAAV